MMPNLVQHFHTFNGGCKRPDRRGHLRNCGFTLKRILESGAEVKPKKACTDYLDKLTDELGDEVCYHEVLIHLKDYHGCTYYEVWRKAID